MKQLRSAFAQGEVSEARRGNHNALPPEPRSPSLLRSVHHLFGLALAVLNAMYCLLLLLFPEAKAILPSLALPHPFNPYNAR